MQRLENILQEKGYYLLNTGEIMYEESVRKKERKTYLDAKGLEKIDFTNTNNKQRGPHDIDKCEVYFDAAQVQINVATSVSEYIQKVLDMPRGNTSHCYYRGQSNWRYELKPSIYRKMNKNILANEDRILKEFLSSKPQFFKECKTTLDILVTLQHHGMPTRLLDITDNPLIALYFACDEQLSKGQEAQHGEVNIFNIKKERFKYYDSDTVSIISNLSKMPMDFTITDYYKEDHNTFNKLEQVKKIVYSIQEEKPHFTGRIEPKHLDNYTVVVKPKMCIERVVNQNGAFILFGMKESKTCCSDLNSVMQEGKRNVIIIPGEYKRSIIQDLDRLNINRATVYGDFDNVTKYLKYKY